MPKAKILAAYVVIDLLIGGGVVLCVFQGIPLSRYLLPAALLFVLNGMWLVVMTIKSTPPRNS